MRRLALTLLALLVPAAAAAQDAGLLAIPQRLDRILPPLSQQQGPDPELLREARNYRGELRDMVVTLSEYARGRSPDFAILVRGGAELLIRSKREAWWDGVRGAGDGASPEGTPHRRYLLALDGIVLDGFYCGEKAKRRDEVMAALRPLLEEGRRLMAIDHCKGAAASAAARQAAADKALLFLAADPRLAAIPPRPASENAASYTNLTLARNVGFALAAEPYDTRAEWVMKLRATNHDVLVVSPFHRGAEPLTAADVASLKHKQLGSRRLVIAALPLASIRDTHLHFEKDWRLGAPRFLSALDPDLPGGFLVDYWDPRWKELVGLTLKGIIDLGYDGVMLGDLDAYGRHEPPMPPPEAEGNDQS